MPVKTFRPLTPSTRYITIADYSDITKTKPEKRLVQIRKKSGGYTIRERSRGNRLGRIFRVNTSGVFAPEYQSLNPMPIVAQDGKLAWSYGQVVPTGTWKPAKLDALEELLGELSEEVRGRQEDLAPYLPRR